MTVATPFWFLLSFNGMILTMCLGALWLWRRPTSPLARRCVLACVLTYAAMSFYPLPRSVASILALGFHPLTRTDVPAGRSVVVLLGSGSITSRDWEDGTLAVLDPIGAERTVEAARIYHLIQPEQVISSGGLIDPEGDEVPSGRSMRDALVGLGVPADRIVVEDRSRNTRDEAVMVAEMIAPLHVDHVVLVTSDTHMRRSLGTFRAAGIAAIPAIARAPRPTSLRPFLVPSEGGLQQTSLVAHELLGLIYYWSRGWYQSRR